MRIDVYHHIAKDSDVAKLRDGVIQLEKHLMKQDVAFQELKTAFTDLETSTTANFKNIADDVKKLQGLAGGMSDLSPANEAIRQEMLEGFARIKAVSKTVADLEPDTTTVEP